jgi:hypothetical protein
MLDHLNQVSIFGRSSFALFLIVGVNLSLSALHIYQEWKGSAVPLWRVFGAVMGVWIPNRLGFVLFAPGLLLLLWAAGLAGIAGWLPRFGPLGLSAAVFALGAVIGARISDSIISHWVLYGLGYRPNPGIQSTPLYIVEAIFLLATFRTGLFLDPRAAGGGLALGAFFFVAVLPLYRAVGLYPPWRREPWVRGQPIPMWAKL